VGLDAPIPSRDLRGGYRLSVVHAGAMRSCVAAPSGQVWVDVALVSRVDIGCIPCRISRLGWTSTGGLSINKGIKALASSASNDAAEEVEYGSSGYVCRPARSMLPVSSDSSCSVNVYNVYKRISRSGKID
jgi:hypothetical protein